jgi:uncharacterized membrane protein
MISRNRVLWVISFAAAGALTASGMHAHNVGPGGFYRQMPGIVLGLFSGYFLDSPVVVIVVTIAANAVLYYFVLRLLMRLWRGAHRRTREEA